MSKISLLSLVLLLSLAVVFPPLAEGGDPARAQPVRETDRIRSLKQIRLEKMVRQKWDLSCGSAALSTILTYHFGDKTSEAVVITSILRISDPIKIRDRGGFSLLDLKKFLAARGYEGNGYGEMTVEELVNMNSPAIVPIKARGFDHFVVFRGVVGNRAVVSDPAFGNMTVKLDQFAAMWKGGIAFFVSRPGLESSLSGGLTPRHEEMLIPDGIVLRRGLYMSPGPLTRR